MNQKIINVALKTLDDLERNVAPGGEDDAALNEVKREVVSAITELEVSKQPTIPVSEPPEELATAVPDEAVA